MQNRLAIGVCAKNEEGGIATCLTSILKSANRLSCDWNLYICVNGSTDSTLVQIHRWITKTGFQCKVLVLPHANLVEAQRCIVNQAVVDKCNYYGFIDADTKIHKYCIPYLMDRIVKNKNIKAVYGLSIPSKTHKPTLIERIMNNYDQPKAEVYSARKHLHGRAFITTDWNIPKNIEEPLICDDIYLSCYLLKKYGEQSIQGVENAQVQFKQIRSFEDYYKLYKRHKLEKDKVLKNYNEFKTLPTDQVYRQFLPKNLLHDSLKNGLLWVLLLGIKQVASYRLTIEKLFYPHVKPQWEETLTSK